LRERAEDIELLVEHYRKRACLELGLDVTLSQRARALLRRHSWPGNVRELQNLVERLVVLTDGPVVEGERVAAEIDQSPTANGAARVPADAKGPPDKEQLLQVLRRSGNNRALAARLLGISRRTLYNRLAAFGITENPDL
jgi:DNA-binding NtrC family response regulator